MSEKKEHPKGEIDHDRGGFNPTAAQADHEQLGPAPTSDPDNKAHSGKSVPEHRER